MLNKYVQDSADLSFALLPALTQELLKFITDIAVQHDNCFSFSGVTCLAAPGSVPLDRKGENVSWKEVRL